MKRIFDIFISASGLILTGPIILVAALIVKLTSTGPAFFVQDRIGRNKGVFDCYKLRTMVTGTVVAGTHEVGSDSVTRVGRFLRSSKIDELPQLWNVLCGDMSIVGPRPCLPVQELLIKERDKRGVYDLRPGITGLAQIEGIDMSTPVKLAEHDALYLNRSSFLYDCRIVLFTLLGKGSGDCVAVEE